MKAAGLKTCRVCRKAFPPSSSTQVVCSPRCALRQVKADKVEARAKVKLQRDRLKSRGQWTAEAQQAFNAWIRWRDRNETCVSCARMHEGQWHAGHYLSTGARPELRFNEANVHRQCQPCNTHLHGNLVLYRANLIGRLGLETVEFLEGPHGAMKWSVAELEGIRDMYRRRLRLAKKGAI